MRSSRIYYIISVIFRLILIVGMTGFSPASTAKADTLSQEQSLVQSEVHDVLRRENSPSYTKESGNLQGYSTKDTNGILVTNNARSLPLSCTNNYNMQTFPPFVYDRDKAVEWALANWNNSAGKNPWGGNGQCVDFVTLALINGGLSGIYQMTTTGALAGWLATHKNYWEYRSIENLTKGDFIFWALRCGTIASQDNCGLTHVVFVTGPNTYAQWNPSREKKYISDLRKFVNYPIGIHIKTDCPSSNSIDKIIIYKDASYQCGGRGLDVGYTKFDLTDGQSFPVPPQLAASSISIPSGWYVYLKDSSGHSALRCKSDDNFQFDAFGQNSQYPYNDPLVDLDDNVTSIEVHQGSCASDSPPNAPPNVPSLYTPYNEHAEINYVPQLTWRNIGDPNGDEVEFRVAVISDKGTIYSEWIKDTYWLPPEYYQAVQHNNYLYGGYQWRVQARDKRTPELTSDWSETWSYIIQSPNNKPPSISFVAANGNPADVIYSKNPNWTFTGTANDPDNKPISVKWYCSGDGCVNAQATVSGTNSWTYTQNNMSGCNDVYLKVYDDLYGVSSRHLNLCVDRAAPVTIAVPLDAKPNSADWYNTAVRMELRADDIETASAKSNVQSIWYRVDAGNWMTSNSNAVQFIINTDGTHTVEYYAVDKAGNAESIQSKNVKIDQTPPSLPVNLQESHNLVSDVWQNTQNIPSFIWEPASDATSGVLGYRFCFSENLNEENCEKIPASARQWTPFSAGVHTGTFYLYVRVQDNAFNWSDWATLFTFRYDNTPPENPADVTHAAGITTDWQNITNLADYSWTAAHDEGSGIQGAYIYWGNDPEGVGEAFISADAYQNLTPLCDLNAACTGYLRLRSLDIADNLAEDWNTVFILRYDNAPPVLDFTINGGVPNTTQTQVTLDISASDEGSGVYAMRFAEGHLADGVVHCPVDDSPSWEKWELPSAERSWTIPAISRQSWAVCAQAKDHVELLSESVGHDVYLDVNPLRPSSSNYQLLDHTPSGGSGAYASDTYTGSGTLGPVADSPVSHSTHYVLSNGYQAGSQAIPLVVPGHEEYTYVGQYDPNAYGIFASGNVAEALQSGSYRMILSVGGLGLPATTTISSASYQLQPGFLAGYQPRPPVESPIIEQPEMPAPDPEPVLTCDAPSVSINGGAAYTDTPNVSLSLCAPFAVEMMLSAQEDFAGAAWEPFAPTRAWAVSTEGPTVQARFVYAQFKEADGTVQATYFDDILYDPNQPDGSLLPTDNIIVPPDQMSMAQWNPVSFGETAVLQAASGSSGPATLPVALDGSVRLYVDGTDDNSGMDQMQVSPDPAFTGAVWQPFSPTVDYTPEDGDGIKTVYARFRDEAGNLSGTTTISFIYETTPPSGYLYADPSVLPGNAVSITLYLGDYEYWSEEDGETPAIDPGFDGGATEMRLGSAPDLSDAYWQPLADTASVAIDPTQPEGTFYAQYRDAAGNVSEIVSASYQIDTVAPDLSAWAEPGTGNTRTVDVYASDELSGIANLYLSNDPLMEQDVVTQPETDTLTWTFDENKVVWIVAEDGVGNYTEPYPVYATDSTSVTISGNAGIAGATLSYTDGTPVTAESDGSYTITVPYNWSGTITPSKTGYTFSPASRSYSTTPVTDNLSNQKFTALVTITGSTGIAGATLSYTDGTAKMATSGSTGSYTITVPYNWAGTITPSKTGYTFSPASRSYSTTPVTDNLSGQNFTALVTLTGNAGESGVTLRYTDGTAKSVTSGSNGRYTITVPYNWSGAVTPSKSGLTFSPASRTYPAVTANQAGQNYYAVMTIPSTGSYDGHILESSETSNTGGSLDATATTFILGDASADRQYRAILAFNTASLPDTATIQSAVVKIKQYGSPVGSNPFSILGSLYTDIRKGYFGTSLSLQTSDFNAAASTTSVAATFGKTPVSGWYSATLTSTGRSYVNKTSWTQLRLRFSKDDNDDGGADYMKFYSGNYSTSSYRPQLVVTYTLP